MDPTVNTISQALESLHEDIFKAVDPLGDAEINWVHPQLSNTIGILLRHVAGSERYWIGEVVGGRAMHRKRETEFTHEPLTKAPLVENLLRAHTRRRRRQYHPSPGVNLVGIGIGEKIVAARPTSEFCVKVLVARKYPRGRISRADRIPASVGGVPVDIEGVGYVRKFQLANQQRRRPVAGGVSGSLAFEAVGFRYAGTLGVIVVDRDHRDIVYALSNNHVLANENRAAVGAGALQPATLDGGRPTDRVAALDRFVPLRYNNEPNRMDAAIARFDAPADATRVILDIGAPTGAGDPKLNLLVRKFGRTE